MGAAASRTRVAWAAGLLQPRDGTRDADTGTFADSTWNDCRDRYTFERDSDPGEYADISGALGIISATGMYTAPANLPVSATLKIAATSLADTTKSSASQVTIASDLQIALSTTAAAVELGATKGFRPLITSSGHPNDAVRWALSGATCPAGCGAVDANGSFTALRILPSSATATLTAQSIADPSKSASAAITITSNFTLQLSAPASVPVGTSAGI
jgi:hypothetical protein